MAVEVDVLARALADFNVVAHSEFKLTPEQEVAVMSLLVGKDVLAVLPQDTAKASHIKCLFVPRILKCATSTVRDICTFAVLCWITRPLCCFTRVYEEHFTLCYKEEL